MLFFHLYTIKLLFTDQKKKEGFRGFNLKPRAEKILGLGCDSGQGCVRRDNHLLGLLGVSVNGKRRGPFYAVL